MKQLLIILAAVLLSTSAIAADWKQEGKQLCYKGHCIETTKSKQVRTMYVLYNPDGWIVTIGSNIEELLPCGFCLPGMRQSTCRFV